MKIIIIKKKNLIEIILYNEFIILYYLINDIINLKLLISVD